MSQRNDEFCQLSPDDAQLLDRLVDNGFEVRALGPLSKNDRRRVAALMATFTLLGDYPVEDADDTLVHATLARVDRFEDERAARLAFDATAQDAPDSERRGLRIRMPDFMTVAAVFLIGVSVGWPMLSFVRQRSIDLTCENNMRMLGVAFANYSDDYGNTMPVVAASLGQSWDIMHNIANVLPLREGGYCEDDHFNCPGHHEHAGPSYSYQMQNASTVARWGMGPRSVVLGDRNPVVDAFWTGDHVSALSISLNHGGRGQNVLFDDGSVAWLNLPLVDKSDNIWLPEGISELRRGVRPASGADVFLVH